MPHGLPGEYPISRSGRAPTKSIAPKISRKMPKTYMKLKIKAFSHASADEYIKGKKGEPSEQKKDNKRKEREVAKDSQQKKNQPEDNQALSSAPKPITSWFNSYTPLNTSREQILMQVKGRNLLWNPRLMWSGGISQNIASSTKTRGTTRRSASNFVIKSRP